MTAGEDRPTLPPDLEFVECGRCGQQVPQAHFCAGCGADLTDPERAHRRHAYAANPNEPVLAPRIVSTLFPHLPHRRAAPFSAALAAVAVLLIGLALFRLTGPAILVAAAALPLLHLFYLHETEVYEDRPLLAVGLTLVVGGLLGYGWAELTGRIITRSTVSTALFGVRSHDVLISGVLLPLAAQVLMLLGPLVLRWTGRFDEVLDGFSFGAASAFGFAFAATLVDRLPELRAGIRADRRQTLDVVVEVVQSGLVLPFLAATATGMLSAILWLRPRSARRRRGLVAGLVLSILIVVAADVAVGLAAVHERRPERLLAITAVLAVVLVLRTRYALHDMLLAEAVDDIVLGEWEPCSHCHRLVPRLPFCPACGIATRATPKTGAGRDLRRTRPPARAPGSATRGEGP